MGPLSLSEGGTGRGSRPCVRLITGTTLTLNLCMGPAFEGG